MLFCARAIGLGNKALLLARGTMHLDHLSSRRPEGSNVVFLRNGREHSAQEAADHLRRKWRGADITAEQFIDRYGTKSSSSGRPYRVRIGDTERDAGPWLHELLVSP